jgi:hypothetical protein
MSTPFSITELVFAGDSPLPDPIEEFDYTRATWSQSGARSSRRRKVQSQQAPDQQQLPFTRKRTQTTPATPVAQLHSDSSPSRLPFSGPRFSLTNERPLQIYQLQLPATVPDFPGPSPATLQRPSKYSLEESVLQLAEATRATNEKSQRDQSAWLGTRIPRAGTLSVPLLAGRSPTRV